jgi:hypothetical protein
VKAWNKRNQRKTNTRKYKKRPRRRIRGNEETGDKEGAMEVCKV